MKSKVRTKALATWDRTRVSRDVERDDQVGGRFQVEGLL